jgi:hypothetical protein
MPLLSILTSYLLPPERRGGLARALEVAPDRIYIEFTNADGALWGWNGTTFA